MSTLIARAMMTQREATAKAIELAGGGSAVARSRGVTRGATAAWKARGRVPPEHVIALEQLCEAQVTRYELRPDVFKR